MSNQIIGDLRVTGNIQAGTAGIRRQDLSQDVLTSYPIDWTLWRVATAFQNGLPAAASGNDLGLVTGVFATDAVSIQSGDLKGAGPTIRYARTKINIPAEYDDGQDLRIRFVAGMNTTVADGFARTDVSAYKYDKEGSITGSDLVTTGQITMNSLTFVNLDFVLNPTNIVSGDVLDVRAFMDISDGVTATAVIGVWGTVELLCDVKG
jgi:hypothetical protein